MPLVYQVELQKTLYYEQISYSNPIVVGDKPPVGFSVFLAYPRAKPSNKQLHRPTGNRNSKRNWPISIFLDFAHLKCCFTQLGNYGCFG